MSSHHFVREGQEPALFIIEASSLNNVESLLEWAPLVMVLDTVLDKVLSWGIKIDVVIAATKSLQIVEEKTTEQFPVQIICYAKDEHPISVGLHALIKNHQAVNIVSGVSDATFQNLAPFCEQINVVLLDHEMRWVPASKKLSKWMPHSSVLFIKKSDGAQNITHEGLKFINDNEFETLKDGYVILSSDSLFWVGENLKDNN
jgi:hypothetical protein